MINALFETPIGTLSAVADEKGLHVLEFVEPAELKNTATGENSIIKNLFTELENYFEGKSFSFKTPIILMGTPFQKTVWKNLQKISPGKTQSYLELAKSVGDPKACRAVARANATNPLAIIVPCHRVINHSGKLGGYAGGIERKRWLLEHERKFAK